MGASQRRTAFDISRILRAYQQSMIGGHLAFLVPVNFRKVRQESLAETGICYSGPFRKGIDDPVAYVAYVCFSGEWSLEYTADQLGLTEATLEGLICNPSRFSRDGLSDIGL